MSRINSRVVARLCMALAMMLLAAACDFSWLGDDTNQPPAEETPTEDETQDAEDPPSEGGGHGDHGDHGSEEPGDESEEPGGGSGGSEDPDDAYGDDVDPDMVNVTEDMLLDGSNGSGELLVRDSENPRPSEQGPFPGIGTFRVFCQLSHMNFDDPIVFPGEKGASHAHQFIGNAGTDADSTPASLASSGNSTCTGGIADRSAYWIPVLVDTATNEVVRPSITAIYYQSGFSNIDAESIQPIPEGLMMIAGDPKATPEDNSDRGFGFRNARWGCFNGGGNGPRQEGDGSTIPDCNSGESVEAIINFPQCWDGENLDSEDHKSHMAYPSRGQCPDSHPVAIPSIMQAWLFPTDGADTSTWRLASDMYPQNQDGGASLHADFVNGWDPDIMNRWLENCVRAEKDCERSELGNGESLGSGRGPF